MDKDNKDPKILEDKANLKETLKLIEEGKN